MLGPVDAEQKRRPRVEQQAHCQELVVSCSRETNQVAKDKSTDRRRRHTDDIARNKDPPPQLARERQYPLKDRACGTRPARMC